MDKPLIAVIGAGNMGTSLIGGLIRDGHPPNKLVVSDLDENKLNSLQQTFQVNVTKENEKALQSADIVIFAVKPQHLAKVVRESANIIHRRHLLAISIAAGVRIASLQQWLGDPAVAIVRAMPNTPAIIGCGATALFANAEVNKKQHDLAESILRALGVVVWLDNEQLMDTVTGLSGSGPAYFFLMMESLQQAAIDSGLPENAARLLTLQTALGAAKMAMESGKPLVDLRLNVTSPGGTTEKAISVLEENDIRGLFKKALQAAKRRSEELANSSR